MKQLVEQIQRLLKSNLLRQSALAFFFQVSGKAITLLLLIFLARILGTKEFGQYSFARNAVFLLGPFATLGFSASASRFVPHYVTLNQFGEAQGFIRAALLTCFVSGTVIAIAAALVIGFLPNLLAAYDIRQVQMSFVAIPIYGLLFLGMPLARTLSLNAIAYAPCLLGQPLIQIGFMLFAIAAFGGLDSATATVGQTISIFAGFGIQLALCYLFINRAVRDAKPQWDLRSWLSVSLPLSTSVISLFLIQRGAPVIVGVAMTPAEAGIFSACFSIATTLSMASDAVNGILLPQISVALAKQDMPAAQNLIHRGFLLAFFPTAAGGILVALFGGILLRALGHDFVSGTTILMIMAAEQVVLAAAGPVSNVLTITKNHYTTIRLMGMLAFVKCGLAFAVVGYGGGEAVALTNLATSILWVIASGASLFSQTGLCSGIWTTRLQLLLK